MFTSIKLGSPFGISVYIHPAFWLLPIFYLFSNLRATSLFHSILEVALLFAVFFCVILHEFGHALAARMFGIQTRDITIYPMGGVARLERMSEDPFEELVIALAGPAVNLVIFFLLLPICIHFSAAPFDFENLTPPNNLSGSLNHYLQMLMLSNLGLLIFNLLPIFPMDGGRVLRALLNLAVGFSNATIASVFLGNLGAIVLVFLGLFSSNYILVLLALFVFIAGRQELLMLRNKRNIGSNSNFTSSGPSTFSSLTWDSQRKTWVYFDANQQPPFSNNP
ncbi:MAG: M50 family metallopeptidase [Gemmataceae bacterium]|nr:M50 family metallopeptidase [Gemmataceae bacterium]